MKKQVITVMMAASTMVAVAQEMDGGITMQVPQKVVYNDGQVCDSVISYATDGKVLSREVYEHDAAGRIVSSAHYETVDDRGLKGMSKQDYQYDTDGNRTQTVSYMWRDGAWEYSIKQDVSYDGDNQTVTSARWNGNEWQNNTKVEMVNNADGKTLQTVSYQWEDNAWKAQFKEVCEYDAFSHRTLLVSYGNYDGIWKGELKLENAYTASGKETLYAYYFWENDDWVLSVKYEHTYDANDNLTSESETSYYGSISKTDYAYTASGQLLSNVYYTIAPDGNISYISKQENEFNAEGYCSALRYYTYGTNNEWYNFKTKEYVCDSRGNRIQATDYSKSGDEWVATARHEYTYDENNHQTSDVYSIYGGNGWEYRTKDEFIINDNDEELFWAKYVWKSDDWECQEKLEAAFDEWNNRIFNSHYQYNEGKVHYGDESSWLYDSEGHMLEETVYRYSYGVLEGLSKLNREYYDDGRAKTIYRYKWENGQFVLYSTSCYFWNDPTNITHVEASRNSDNTFYNVNGQRVAPNHKGIVICNGRKVMVK